MRESFAAPAVDRSRRRRIAARDAAGIAAAAHARESAPGCRRPFRELGIAARTSLLTVCCTFALCTSTIGVSPVTVIVSSRAPTFRSPFTVATNVPGQLDAFALDGAEARQRERHRVGARAAGRRCGTGRCRR